MFLIKHHFPYSSLPVLCFVPPFSQPCLLLSGLRSISARPVQVTHCHQVISPLSGRRTSPQTTGKNGVLQIIREAFNCSEILITLVSDWVNELRKITGTNVGNVILIKGNNKLLSKRVFHAEMQVPKKKKGYQNPTDVNVS